MKDAHCTELLANFICISYSLVELYIAVEIRMDKEELHGTKITLRQIRKRLLASWIIWSYKLNARQGD